MVKELQQVIPEDPESPYRLGRNVNFDQRSARFPFAARPEAEVKVVSRPAWTTRIGVLDQGADITYRDRLYHGLGSCTGNDGTAFLATDSTGRQGLTYVGMVALDEAYAVGLYSDATQIDPWPGAFPTDDTGSDNLSIAKVLKTRGLVDSYAWAFGGLDDVLRALQSQPVMLGTVWYGSMFHPTADGELRISAGSSVAGGHSYLADGQVDVERRQVWVRNSWGEGWGLGGRAWLSYDTLTRLLAEDGDAAILHASVAVPEPPPFQVRLSARDRASVERRARRRHLTPEEWLTWLVHREVG